MQDLISVIVPVYKVEKYLDKCVQSIVDQTYTNLEIILVDDGSPDNCPQMCDEWAKRDSRIKVIHKENGGVSSARNIGLKNTTGEWVMFVDADDYIALECIKDVYSRCKQKKCDIASFEGMIIYSDGISKKMGGKNVVTKELSVEDSIKSLLKNMSSVVWGHIFSKNVLTNVLFNEEMHNKEDMLFLMQSILKSKKILFISDIYYYYIQHGNSGSSVTYEKTLDYITLLNKFEKIFEDKNEYNKEFLACKITSHYMVAKRLWSLGIKDENYKNSIKFLNKNIFNVLNPFFKMKNIRLKIVFILYFKWAIDLLKKLNK